MASCIMLYFYVAKNFLLHDSNVFDALRHSNCLPQNVMGDTSGQVNAFWASLLGDRLPDRGSWHTGNNLTKLKRWLCKLVSPLELMIIPLHDSPECTGSLETSSLTTWLHALALMRIFFFSLWHVISLLQLLQSAASKGPKRPPSLEPLPVRYSSHHRLRKNYCKLDYARIWYGLTTAPFLKLTSSTGSVSWWLATLGWPKALFNYGLQQKVVKWKGGREEEVKRKFFSCREKFVIPDFGSGCGVTIFCHFLFVLLPGVAWGYLFFRTFLHLTDPVPLSQHVIMYESCITVPQNQSLIIFDKLDLIVSRDNGLSLSLPLSPLSINSDMRPDWLHKSGKNWFEFRKQDRNMRRSSIVQC